MKYLSFFAVFLLYCSPCFAQNASNAENQQKEPQTKLEQFQIKKGSVIIHGFSPVGKIEAKYGATVSVEAREFTDGSNGMKQYGIVIELKEGGRLERENSSYIDADEIDSLVKGIEYIGRVNKSATKLSDFQADYRTKGDFMVSTFSDKAGKVAASVKSGRFSGSSAFIEITDLVKLRDLIIAAQKLLQSI